MKQNARIFDKFEYFVEDCRCRHCVNCRGESRSCIFSKCAFDDIKQDAIAHGRIKRKRKRKD